MVIATLTDITKSYPSGVVLEKLNASIKKGDKIGLVGANGSGKTTLLEILAGIIDIESGEVNLNKNIGFGYLPQIPEAGDLQVKLIDYLKSAHSQVIAARNQLQALEKRLENGTATPEDIRLYGQKLEWLDFQNGFSLESDLEKIAIGLGLPKQFHQWPLAQLSGGQLNRAALARLLSTKPELMLLDEPTNHLDIEAIKFLEQYLANSSAAAVIVSHDRRFLDNVCQIIWELRRARLKIFKGNFSAYLEKRKQDDELAFKAYTRQQEFIARTEAFIRKNIAGQKTNQAKSRQKMLARMEKKEKPLPPEKKIRLEFAEAARSERIVCMMNNVSFGYDGNSLLEGISLTIERGQRIGLLGENGSGKTTLLRIIAGEIKPDSGEYHIGKNLKIGFFRQTRIDFGEFDTPIGLMKSALPQLSEGNLRNILAGFLFEGEDVFRPMATFSGGQKSRLSLALLIAAQPNFMLLDEPTNHLDIPSIEALENALDNYEGTLLIVSHDRYFLDGLVNTIYYLKAGRLYIYDGNYSFLESKQSEQQREKLEATQGNKNNSNKMRSIKTTKIRKTNPIVIEKLKDEIAVLEAEYESLQENAGSSEYASDWQYLQKIEERKAELENLILNAYERLDRLMNPDSK